MRTDGSAGHLCREHVFIARASVPTHSDARKFTPLEEPTGSMRIAASTTLATVATPTAIAAEQDSDLEPDVWYSTTWSPFSQSVISRVALVGL
jgi:hypothetical protein